MIETENYFSDVCDSGEFWPRWENLIQRLGGTSSKLIQTERTQRKGKAKKDVQT